MTRAWLVVAIGACFSEPPPYDKLPNVDGCKTLAIAQCSLHDTCTGGFQSIRAYGDEPTCEQRTVLVCVNSSQIRDTGQTPDQLATCASQTMTASCSAFFEDNPPPACVAAGPGAAGDPCGVDNECRSGYCSVATDAICGTCQPKPQIGDACMVVGDCGHDLACVRPNSATIGSCAAWIEETGTCDETNPCAPTLSCLNSKCVKAAADGEPCDGTGATAPICNLSHGLSCIGTTCMPNARVNAGDPCGSFTSPQRVATCIAGAECVKPIGDKTGVCVAAAADGAACNNDPSIGPPCLSPAKCVAGVCTVPDPRACRTH